MVLRGPDGEEAGVTYADLERAKTVVLAGLEPEDEAGSIFLRLRKANRAGTTSVIAISPYTSRGSQKLRARVIPTAPGDEAAALAALAIDSEAGLDADSVVLLGDRLATSPGAYAAAVKLAESTGARLAWVPRRAGDRGAVEAGCLPTLLPGGRPGDRCRGSCGRGRLMGRRDAARPSGPFDRSDCRAARARRSRRRRLRRRRPRRPCRCRPPPGLR
ncbi:MAG: hypothetical protein V9F00_16915 [Nocardioides sp.]